MNNKEIESPESKQIASFEDYKRQIEADIEVTEYEISAKEEKLERKRAELDMYDYLIDRLKGRIKEKEG